LSERKNGGLLNADNNERQILAVLCIIRKLIYCSQLRKK